MALAANTGTTHNGRPNGRISEIYLRNGQRMGMPREGEREILICMYQLGPINHCTSTASPGFVLIVDLTPPSPLLIVAINNCNWSYRPAPNRHHLMNTTQNVLLERCACVEHAKLILRWKQPISASTQSLPVFISWFCPSPLLIENCGQ